MKLPYQCKDGISTQWGKYCPMHNSLCKDKTDCMVKNEIRNGYRKLSKKKLVV